MMDEDYITAIFIGLFFFVIIIYKLYIITNEKYKKYKLKKEYYHKYNNDPVFKLQEDYKVYTNGHLYTKNNVWLDSQNKNEIIQIKNMSEILFEGTIDDPLMKTIIEVKKTLGEELKRCRECGKIEWAYINRKAEETTWHYYKNWNGFCSETCEEKCRERDIDHYWRITKNPCRDYDYKYKKNYMKKYKSLTNQFDYIPLYEYSEKQNFKCAVCGGKMNHEWIRHENNYLYHTIDHILPINKGGQHRDNNIQIVHLICNMVKWTNDNIKLKIGADQFLKDNVEKIYNEKILINEYRKYIKK
ncbi:MAG: HNH endonuclease [Treponema sp.]|jgi:5-methylcytosine-specific restriction endonuclease McrA|nr:HNH endonuclease [Treponema sp.]